LSWGGHTHTDLDDLLGELEKESGERPVQLRLLGSAEILAKFAKRSVAIVWLRDRIKDNQLRQRASDLYKFHRPDKLDELGQRIEEKTLMIASMQADTDAKVKAAKAHVQKDGMGEFEPMWLSLEGFPTILWYKSVHASMSSETCILIVALAQHGGARERSDLLRPRRGRNAGACCVPASDCVRASCSSDAHRSPQYYLANAQKTKLSLAGAAVSRPKKDRGRKQLIRLDLQIALGHHSCLKYVCDLESPEQAEWWMQALGSQPDFSCGGG
jgi:hypothetical protein